MSNKEKNVSCLSFFYDYFFGYRLYNQTYFSNETIVRGTYGSRARRSNF
jgi:hypothetical protein